MTHLSQGEANTDTIYLIFLNLLLMENKLYRLTLVHSQDYNYLEKFKGKEELST